MYEGWRGGGAGGGAVEILEGRHSCRTGSNFRERNGAGARARAWEAWEEVSCAAGMPPLRSADAVGARCLMRRGEFSAQCESERVALWSATGVRCLEGGAEERVEGRWSGWRGGIPAAQGLTFANAMVRKQGRVLGARGRK